MDLLQGTQERAQATPSAALDPFESDAVELARPSVLLLVPPGEASSLEAAMASQELKVLRVDDVAQARRLARLPRYAVVAVELPGALDLVRELAGSGEPIQVLALIGHDMRESAALGAGASATLRRPAMARDVLTFIERFAKHEAFMARTRDLLERHEAPERTSLAVRVAAAIAQEIRSPLTVAVLNVAALQGVTCGEGTKLSSKQRNDICRETRAVLERVDTILSTVTNLARGERPALSPVPLFDVAQAVLGRVRNPDDVPIDLGGSRLVRGIGNEPLLEQVLTSLLRTALEAARHAESRRVTIQVHETAAEATISVQHTGPDVPPSDRGAACRPRLDRGRASGASPSTKGAGLELASLRDVVRSMGGFVTVANARSRGACVRVRLQKA